MGPVDPHLSEVGPVFFDQSLLLSLDVELWSELVETALDISVIEVPHPANLKHRNVTAADPFARDGV